MENTKAKIERKYLLSSTALSLVVGVVGVGVSAISSSQAILLDGVFNLTYFATGLFTLQVARLVQRGDDEHFPFGYGFFEPLVNGIKGLLVLGISVMALLGAVEAIFAGGRAIGAGAAVGYGVFATIACWGAAAITHVGAGRTASPLIQADAANWIVNAAISSAVLAAFVGMFLVQGTTLEFITPYVDPLVVLVVVLISISVPVRMAWRALMELLNRAPGPEIVQQVRATVESSTADMPVVQLFVRVSQPGRTRMVLAHVVLPADFQPAGLTALDAVRLRTYEQLHKHHTNIVLDMVFTSDPIWGAPTSKRESAESAGPAAESIPQ